MSLHDNMRAYLAEEDARRPRRPRKPRKLVEPDDSAWERKWAHIIDSEAPMTRVAMEVR